MPWDIRSILIFVSITVSRRGSILFGHYRIPIICPRHSSGLDYDVFFNDWHADLLGGFQAHASQLTQVPVITDSLIIEPHDNLRDVKVKITVENGESSLYNVFFSYYINNSHREPSYQAQGNHYETIATIGTDLPVGTQIRYDVVVWSDILLTWIKSGWKHFTLE